MADTKITALTAITTVDPANDVLPIVDVSDTSMAASGTTKKITTNQLLGASGTATLASATITGAATAASLTVTGSTIPTNGLYLPTTNTLEFAANSLAQYRIAPLGVFSWFDGAGGTRMTLNSTGLGVGEAASVSRLQPRGSTSDSSAYVIYAKNSGGSVINFMRNDGRFIVGNGTTDNFIVTETGNVGIGVTPSAWVSSSKAIDIAAWAGVGYIASSAATVITNNTYKDAASNWVFKNGTNAAGYFEISQSMYRWWQAPAAGGAGTTAAMVQAMTLDTSGNLLVGKTSAIATAVGIQFQPAGTSYHTLAASTNSDTTLLVYSTGAAAYRFYVGLGGTVYATNTTISAISDQRLKENVQDIDVGLGAILALKPRKFDWKAGKGKDIKGDRGFIAQEFEEVFPNLIDEWKDPAPEGEAPYKSVRQDLIPVLVKAIQELTARVQTLETR